MSHLGSIQAAWQTSLMFGAGVGAVLVARWLWERVNLLAEAASIAVSLLLAPVLLLTIADDWLRLLLMSAASVLVVLLAALLGPRNDAARNVEFYRRVRPPGWWTRSALDAGVDPAHPRAELRRCLLQVAACAVSTYAWLIGATGLLLGTYAPWKAALALVLGAAAVPAWWGAMRDDAGAPR